MTTTAVEWSNVAALGAAGGPAGVGAAPPHAHPTPAPSGQVIELGYGASLTDLGAFDQSMRNAVLRIEAAGAKTSAAAESVMRTFDSINVEAASLARDAQQARQSGRELSPGEMVSLTVRCQEFMFHCQLTSNIANRTSDGLQQLFRQQS